MWIYTTAAVTSHVYGTTDTTSALYNEGANWVGVGLRHLQRRRRARGLRASRSWRGGPAARPPTPSAWSAARSGCSRSLSSQDPRLPAGLHGGRRHRLGEHPRHALRDPDRVAAAVEDGVLHGRLQFLHRDPPDRRGGHPGLLRRALLRRGGDLRAADRRCVAPARRGAHAPGRGQRTTWRPAMAPGIPPRPDRPRRWLCRRAPARPRRRRRRADDSAAAATRSGGVLEQRHRLLPAHRSLPERRSHQ